MHNHLVATALSAALLAACGGGGTSTSAQRLSISKGVVTAKGSLTVNGVQFSTTGATVRFEDQPGTEADLKVGMVVKVKGRHDDRTGEATEIEFEDAARGRVDAKVGDVVRVGEQEIEVEHSTEFEDDVARLSSIQVGERIRVSGVATASGRIRATRIDKEAGSSSDFEVKGFVSLLTMGPPITFALKVTPDAAGCIAVTLGDGVSLPAGVADGSFVEVRSPAGPAAAVPPATCASSITAGLVELEDARLGAENDEVEVEGLVTSGDSASFMLEGQAVVTLPPPGTSWENGVPADLVPGVRIEAEGSLDAQGLLHATKVSFRENIRLQDAASNVVIPDPADPRTGSFTMLGVPGIIVLTDGFTDWNNGLDLGTVVASGPVQVRGYRFTSSMACSTSICVVATRVDSTNDTRLFLQGPVTSKDASAMTLGILGFTVAATGKTEYRDVSDAPIDAATFFATVIEGRTVVKARGRDATALSGSTLSAEELELEGDR